MLEGLYDTIAAFGVYGVDVFFVISGFVIPLALRKSKFTYQKVASFWISRFARLYPSYFFASLVGLVFWYASTLLPGFRGAPLPPVTTEKILSNLGLFCDLAGEQWFLGVAWTLAIEAQYYVLIALVFPFLTCGKNFLKMSALVLWISMPLLFSNIYLVFYWTAIFGMGLLVMLYQQKIIGSRMLAVLLFSCFAIQSVTRSGGSAFFGLATALFILLVPPLRLPGLIWLGGISYSLYLLHQPFGGRVMNCFERFPGSPLALLISVPLAIAVSVLAAYVFFRVVELPSHSLSRLLRDKL